MLYLLYFTFYFKQELILPLLTAVTANPDIFINYIDSSIDEIQKEGKLCVILGDFNLDLLKF